MFSKPYTLDVGRMQNTVRQLISLEDILQKQKKESMSQSIRNAAQLRSPANSDHLQAFTECQPAPIFKVNLRRGERNILRKANRRGPRKCEQIHFSSK